MKNKRKNRKLRYLLWVAAVTAICWDLAVSTQEIEPGTFRYESEFAPLPGIPATVSIVTSDYAELPDPVDRNTDPTYVQIEEMVAKAIELQGGFGGVIEKGDTVMIKVNLVGGNALPGDGENTDPRVVKALIRLIGEYTEGDVVIEVAEGTARSNDDPTDTNSVWGISGYIDLLSDTLLSGIDFSLLNLNQTTEDLAEVDLGSEGTDAKQGTIYHIHKAELAADVYITVPVLKIHNPGITNALKLQIGTAPGCYYGYNKTKGTAQCPDGLYHEVDQRVWTTEAIVDLCNIAGIDFVVVDAIMCLEIQKNNTGSNQVRFNTVLAGRDPVAVDHVSTELFGLNPDDIAHITLAEKVGLGTNDPALISVAGVPVEQAMKRVKKSRSSDGKFGQSNRTWILSQAFTGTDYQEEFFWDEANIQPLPGEDGWSEPVYFFDDRLDLYAYYSGQTDIVTYAFTYFDAPQDQEAELWLGYEEGISVYLNGEQVYSIYSYSTLGDDDRGSKRKIIELKKGRNTLLVKTLNRYGDYSFVLNICEVESDENYNGNRVGGLKFYLDDSGSGTSPTTIPITPVKSTSGLRCIPNPSREYAQISFELAEPGQAAVSILDLSGKLVRSLGSGSLSSGIHEYTWNLTDDQGERVSSGIYLCSMVSGNQHQCIRLVVE